MGLFLYWRLWLQHTHIKKQVYEKQDKSSLYYSMVSLQLHAFGTSDSYDVTKPLDSGDIVEDRVLGLQRVVN